MPYNSDDEEEMELELGDMVEVMPVEEEGDHADLSKSATRATSTAADEDESTEEDDDDDDDEDDNNNDEDDTDSEPEMEPSPSASSLPTPLAPSALAAGAPHPKMRIKLKMPKRTAPAPATAADDDATAPSSAPKAISSDGSARSTNPLPMAAASASTAKPSNSDDVVVVSVGGNKPKPNLPLKRLPTAGLLKKPAGDSGSLTGSNSGKKSRIRTLKLPLSKKPKEEEEAEEEAVAAEVVSTGRLTPGGGTYSKRRSMHPSKPIKLPPLVSPGLIVTQSGVKKASAELFDEAMETAGYTESRRTERPHRGSSIKRQVGDLFDSNVKLSMHFPALVPPELWDSSSKKDEDGDAIMQEKEDEAAADKFSPQDLIRELRQTLRPTSTTFNGSVISFDHMLPVSLTAPLPDSYVEERLNYVRAVEARENAIVAIQAAEEEAEFGVGDPPTEKIPPIPVPPEPPRLENVDLNTLRDEYPYYLPKQPSLVAHLDPKAFHIVDGRYFGLLSNNISDPNFCGPNAGPNTGGSALATAGSAATGTPLTLSTFLFSSHPPGAAASISNTASGANNSNNASNKSNEGSAPNTTPTGENTQDGGKAAPESGKAKVSASSKTESKKDAASAAVVVKPVVSVSSSSKEKKKGPTPTASASTLRRTMEEGGDVASEMRKTIRRAAVYASRTGGHGQSFVTPSGDIYPDIGKAFAAYAGIKPCERCKSNKQGSYHCRLRRKHTEPDFDGGSSFEVLRELQQQPVDSLVPSVDAAAMAD